jgi:hypothetical protein
MTELQSPLFTTTGELYQLGRVYYQVFNQATVLGVFKKLRCMEFDGTKNRWVWLFEDEAKKIRLGKPHSKLPKEIRPVVIGSFTFRGEDQMLLDVRSLERVTQAIEFFDKRINRRAAQVTNLRIVNKLFEATQEKAQQLLQQSPDSFFDCDNISRPADEFMASLEQFKKEENIEIRRQKALAWIEQQAKAPRAEVEEMPTHFYEDGIEQLKRSLQLRQLELLEHWKGNSDANMLNIIQKIVNSNPQNFS